MGRTLQIIFLIIGFVFSIFNKSKAQSSWTQNDLFNSSCFVENKGQLKFNSEYPNIRGILDLGTTLVCISPNGYNILSKSGELLNAVEFLNSNLNSKIKFENKLDDYYTYEQIPEKVNCFKKIIFFEIYPGIDMSYTIDNKGSFKYSFDLHKNGQAEKIKFKFKNGFVKLNKSRNLFDVETEYCKIIEFGLVIKTAQGEQIPCTYNQNKNIIGIQVPSYLQKSNFVIDPWVDVITTLNRNSKQYKPTVENIGLKVDYDATGNLYVFGGQLISGYNDSVQNFSKIAKYSPSGKLLWTFQGYVKGVFSSKYTNGSEYYGHILVDKFAGKIYVSNGTYNGIGGAKMIRLDTSGMFDFFVSDTSVCFKNVNAMLFSNNDSSIYAFGGSLISSQWKGYDILQVKSNQSIGLFKFANNKSFTREVINAVTDDYGNYYGLFNHGYDSINGTFLYKINSNMKGYRWKSLLNFRFPRDTFLIIDSAIGYRFFHNSVNALAANKDYLFVFNGKSIAAVDLISGKLIGNIVNIPNQSEFRQSGIVCDNCNNIIVGGDSGFLKCFIFDGKTFKFTKNLNFGLPNRKRAVRDIQYNRSSGLLYLTGDSFVAVVDSKINCHDSSLDILDQHEIICKKDIVVNLKTHDSLSYYSYNWFDSTINKNVRFITKKNKLSDTLNNLLLNHIYHLNIYKNRRLNTYQTSYRFVVRERFDSMFNVSACFGDTLLMNGRKFFKSDTFIQSYTSIYGCDSIVRINVKFGNTSILNQNVIKCKNQKIKIGKHNYSFDGLYLDTLVNTNQCDSIVVTKITNLPDTTSLFFQRCSKDTLKLFPGYSLFKTGTYTFHIKNFLGCDSTIIVKLKIHNDTIIKHEINLCNNDSVFFNKQYIHDSGIYRDTLSRRFFNCDSFVYLKVNKLQHKDSFISAIICTDDSIVIGNKVYKDSGHFQYSLKNRFGCDSFVYIKIQKDNVIPYFSVDSSNIPEYKFTFIPKSPKEKFIWNLDDGIFDSTNSTVKHIYPSLNSSKKIRLTVIDSLGCIGNSLSEVNTYENLIDFDNTLTPNSDGKNDVLYVFSRNKNIKCNLLVYNRWGALVHVIENSPVDNSKLFWNGNVNNGNIECPSGSYFGQLDLMNSMGKRIHHYEFVITLIR